MSKKYPKSFSQSERKTIFSQSERKSIFNQSEASILFLVTKPAVSKQNIIMSPNPTSSDGVAGKSVSFQGIDHVDYLLHIL